MAAKWLHPVLFCNDINIKTLIDITLYDEEHMLITCRSFIKRFNVTDRTQVNSWITKSWHPFSSGAVRLPNSDKIYAVVNHSSLYHWPVVEKDIQNFKKNVFKSQIHALIPGTDDRLYLIYSYGFIEPLEAGLKTRKEPKPQLIGINESILQSHIFHDRNDAALLVRNKIGDVMLYQVKISSNEKFTCTHINVKTFQLTGLLFVPSGELLTTWSDGNLYSMKNLPKSKTSTPGNVKGKLSNLKANKRIKMLYLSSDHVALQGMNINQEGGLVVLFDTKFGVTVSTKSLKMYKDPPLAFTVPSGVVAAEGDCLVYIPVSLSPSTVGSMLGCNVNEKYFDNICVGWKRSEYGFRKDIPLSAIESFLSNKSAELTNVIEQLNLGTSSEDLIVNAVVSSLIESKNIKLLSECISSFSFMPEKCLASMLKLLLALPDEFFEKPNFKKKHKRKRLSTSISLEDSSVVTNGISDSFGETSMDVDLGEGLRVDVAAKKEVVCPFTKPKCAFINEILIQPFSGEIMGEEIMTLNFKSSLALIQYLHYLLASGEAQILNDKNKDFPTIEKASLWLGLLFDANYQQFVMTSQVEIYRMLLTVFSDITCLLEFWEASHSIDILVERVEASSLIRTTQVNGPYSIERLIL